MNARTISQPVRPASRIRFRFWAPFVALLIFASASTFPVVSATAETPTAQVTSSSRSASAATAAGHRMFAYYYLWWSTRHWHQTLGRNFPYRASPLPLPASLDAACNTRSRFPGNRLTDVPAALWSQDDAAVIERDVRQALGAGLAGFAVNWAGSGTRSQTVNSTPYSRRLDVLVRVVNKVRGEGHRFSLWISYKSSARRLGTTAMVNDLAYLHRAYGKSPAFDRTNGKRPTLIMMGSRKYGTQHAGDREPQCPLTLLPGRGRGPAVVDEGSSGAPRCQPVLLVVAGPIQEPTILRPTRRIGQRGERLRLEPRRQPQKVVRPSGARLQQADRRRKGAACPELRDGR